jgi:hypothetical protein
VASDAVAAEASGMSLNARRDNCIFNTYVAAEGLKPSHGARDQPGTKHTDIFAADPEDDALAQAPPKLTEVRAKSSSFNASN